MVDSDFPMAQTNLKRPIKSQLKRTQWMWFMTYLEASLQFKKLLKKVKLSQRRLEGRSLTGLLTLQEELLVTYYLTEISQRISVPIKIRIMIQVVSWIANLLQKRPLRANRSQLLYKKRLSSISFQVTPRQPKSLKMYSCKQLLLVLESTNLRRLNTMTRIYLIWTLKVKSRFWSTISLRNLKNISKISKRYSKILSKLW